MRREAAPESQEGLLAQGSTPLRADGTPGAHSSRGPGVGQLGSFWEGASDGSTAALMGPPALGSRHKSLPHEAFAVLDSGAPHPGTITATVSTAPSVVEGFVPVSPGSGVPREDPPSSRSAHLKSPAPQASEITGLVSDSLRNTSGIPPPFSLGIPPGAPQASLPAAWQGETPQRRRGLGTQEEGCSSARARPRSAVRRRRRGRGTRPPGALPAPEWSSLSLPTLGPLKQQQWQQQHQWLQEEEE